MNFRVAACLFAAASLSACDLGEGSRPVSVTIIPAGVVKDGTLQMTECFREPLALQVTFSDGQIGNATSRAIWSVNDSANPSNPAVQVSNGDVAAQEIINGEFGASRLTFGRGVLIPKAVTTTPVTITADFLGLKATLPVVVDSLASLSAVVVPRPVVSADPASPKFIGVGFAERFTIRLTKNGRIVDAGDFSRTDSIFNSFLNPVLWTFDGGNFLPANTDNDDANVPASLLDNTAVFVVGGVGTREDATATLTPSGGLVTGVKSHTGVLNVKANLSSVAGAGGAPCPTLEAGVSIAAVDQLVLSHEPEFNALNMTPSSATVSDLVVGTNEFLKVTATLDGTTTETQNVTSQVGYEVIEEDRDVCVEFSDTSTTSATPATRCTSSILTFGLGGFLTTIPGTDGSFNDLIVSNLRFPGNDTTDLRFNGDDTIDPVKVRACFPACTIDSNDPEPDPANVSNTLDIRAVPAQLVATVTNPVPVVIEPATPSQLAFTVPGVQFKAYGTYTAGSIVNGAFVAADMPEQRFSGDSATATQNIGRFMTWFARPEGMDDEFSDVAQLTNGTSNGNTEAAGQVFYICNPIGNVDVDIIAITNNTVVVSTAISDVIVPAKLTVKNNDGPPPAEPVTDRACEP